jgi:hypothetical protein
LILDCCFDKRGRGEKPCPLFVFYKRMYMQKIKLELWIFIIIFLAAFLLIIAGPFAQIWAVNTLFKTSIEYSWLNWFCVILLNSSISAVSYKGKS